MIDMGRHKQKRQDITLPAAFQSAEGTPRSDYLWVAYVIAACVMAEVWSSWVTIGSKSGFAKLFSLVPTDWILALTMEGYWGYALFTALSRPAGPRSSRFAKWTAGVVFVFSLAGQAAAHLLKPGQLPPPAVIVFVTDMPVLVLALFAILVHLRQADRAKARAAERAAAAARQKAADEAAAADERTLLRAELDRVSAAAEQSLSALRDEMTVELQAAQLDRESAQREAEHARGQLAGALARAEKAEQKLAAASAQKKRAKLPASAPAASGDGDPTNELRAVMELRADPKLLEPRMGGELARRLGLSAPTGRRLYGKLVADGALTEYAQSLIAAPAERSQ